MRKTYITNKPRTRYELTFRKSWFMHSDEVRYLLVETILKKRKGFEKPMMKYPKSLGGYIDMTNGEINEDYQCNLDCNQESFIRKQWLKHKGDFLKSRK